jgi:hypothetical protein
MVIPTFINPEPKRDKKGAYITVYFKQDLDITEDMIPYVNYQIIFKNTPKYDYCGFYWHGGSFPSAEWINYWEELRGGVLFQNAIGYDCPFNWGVSYGYPFYWTKVGDFEMIKTCGEEPIYDTQEFRLNIPDASYTEHSSIQEQNYGIEAASFVKKGDKKFTLYVAKRFFIYGIDTELKPQITSLWRVTVTLIYSVVFDHIIPHDPEHPEEPDIYVWKVTLTNKIITNSQFSNQIWYPKNVETNFELLINVNKK